MSSSLLGLRVVVTRPVGQGAGLAAGFEGEGAEVELLPLLEVVAPGDEGALARAVREVESFRWVAFTSANAVRALVDRLPGGWPEGTAAAAVGRATAAALRRRGVEARLVAQRSTGRGLAEEMAAAEDLAGVRVLLPLAADARPELAAGLVAAGAEVVPVVAYEKRVVAGAEGRVAQLFPAGEGLGWVTFTSPRLVVTFAGLVDQHAGGWSVRRETLMAASIGPTTSRALRTLGVEPAAEAATPGDAGLVAAVVRAVGSPAGWTDDP